MRISRSTGGRGHLERRIWIFSVAAILALAGIYRDERWLIGTALAVLASAMLLRWLPGGEDAAADANLDGLRHEEDEEQEAAAEEETRSGM